MGNEYENLKKQRYLQFVQQCARSGKSKREWCRENGVKYSTFNALAKAASGRTGRGNSGRAGGSYRYRWNCREQVSRQSAETFPANSASAVCGEGIEIRHREHP